MKKLLVVSLVSLLTFLLLDKVVHGIASYVINNSEFRFAKLYSSRLNGDFIVFGNSRAVNGFFVPRLSELTGMAWVNAGYNGLGPELVEALVLDMLDRGSAPRAIVLEVSNLTQGNEGIRDLRLFRMRSPRLGSIDAQESGVVGYMASWFASVASNGEALLRCVYHMRRSDQAWVNGGKLDPASAETMKEEAGLRLLGDPTLRGVEATVRLVKYLRARDIEVWCVISPYLLNEGDRAFADRWLSEIRARTDQGTHFVNLVDAVLEPRMYADPLHLNAEGALCAAELLFDRILKSRPAKGIPK
jgi:hypothetical protein